MDTHILSGFQRHRAPHQRVDCCPAGPQEILHDLSGDFHGKLPALWNCAQPGDDYSLSRSARRGRWWPAADGPGDSGRFLSASTARLRLCPLRHYDHRGAHDWPDAWRLDYRQYLLAVDFLYQPARRYCGVIPGLSTD